MRLHRVEWTYKHCPIYFCTLVAHERKPLFANSCVDSAFNAFAAGAAQHGVLVGRYVLMPDHIHFFAAFGSDASNLSIWVKSLKNALSKCLRSNGVPSPHWQKGFFDHILRSDESYASKWDYVRMNPVRAGLVRCPEEWKFQGEVFQLKVSS